MKIHSAKRAGALFLLSALLLIGTKCSASPVTATIPARDAAAQSEDDFEMKNADERLTKAQAQLDLAKRQLSAAKTLLKAAEADLRAAKADRDAVALRYTAQTAAEQAGIPSQAGRAVATPSPQESSAPAVHAFDVSTRTQLADRSSVPTPASSDAMPAAATGQPASAAQSMDYGAMPQQTDGDAILPVMLR